MTHTIDARLIGNSIKNLRQRRHWTQDYVANNLIFCSVRNLRRYENEGVKDIDLVNAFAKAFEVSAIDILRGVFLFVFENKKNIGDLRHTLLTLICYSRTFTAG